MVAQGLVHDSLYLRSYLSLISGTNVLINLLRLFVSFLLWGSLGELGEGGWVKHVGCFRLV